MYDFGNLRELEIAELDAELHMHALYIKREEARDEFIVKHPETGELVSRETLPDTYCNKPAIFKHEEALELAVKLKLETDRDWQLVWAPKPCPSCGREIWADDLDFCYPQNRERTKWRAGCNEHDFGCGFEVTGSSEREVMLKWESYDNRN